MGRAHVSCGEHLRRRDARTVPKMPNPPKVERLHGSRIMTQTVLLVGATGARRPVLHHWANGPSCESNLRKTFPPTGSFECSTPKQHWRTTTALDRSGARRCVGLRLRRRDARACRRCLIPFLFTPIGELSDGCSGRPPFDLRSLVATPIHGSIEERHTRHERR